MSTLDTVCVVCKNCAPFCGFGKTWGVFFLTWGRLYGTMIVERGGRMLSKKANKIWKKYKFCNSLLIFAGLVVFSLGVFSQKVVLVVLTTLVYLFLASSFRGILVRKFLMAPLLDHLDVALYREIVIGRRSLAPLASWRINAEYFSGNYQNVIALCTQMCNRESEKKNQYHYLGFLANVYFDRGDAERLREVCEAFDRRLASEKNQKQQRKIAARFLRLQAYKCFLENDWERCLALLSKTAKTNINVVYQAYFKARVALEKGEMDEAKQLFETVIQMAPALNYAELSMHGIEAMEKGVSYGDTFTDLPVAEVIEVPPMPKTYAIRFLSTTLFLVVVVYYCGRLIDWENRRKEYEEELAAYREEICVLVEDDYDGVEVLELLWPEKDGEIVDSMFLCQTDDGVILGSVYSYEDEDELYFDRNMFVDFETLESEQTPLAEATFACATSDYMVSGAFYRNESEIPTDNYYCKALSVNGKTVYFAITAIEPLI